MEEYGRECQLIFKLQQRKLNKFKVLAEHVVGQIDPDWKENSLDEAATLRSHLEACFKMTRECRISNDITYFRIGCDKRVEVQVQGIANLAEPGNLS